MRKQNNMKVEITKLKIKKQKIESEYWIQLNLELKLTQLEKIMVAKQNIKVINYEKDNITSNKN